MSVTEDDFKGPYRGTSPGDTGNFTEAARDAEQDLLDKNGGRAPHPAITYKAELSVTIGNPIHEFIVELTRQN